MLAYPDYRWRIRQVAREQLETARKISIALPVASARQNLITLVLADANWFVCELDRDAQLAWWVPIAGPMPDHLPFGSAHSEVAREEYEALLDTYYEVLTAPEGPLHRELRHVATAAQSDLRELFRALVGPGLIPAYLEVAPHYMEFLGVARPE